MGNRVSRWLAVGAGILLSSACAWCFATVQVQVEPAWNGLAKEGSSTELKFLLNASDDSDIKLTVQDPLASLPTHRLTTKVLGGEQTILYLTVAEASNRPLQLEITYDNQTVQQPPLQLQTIGRDRQLVAVVGTETLSTSNPRQYITQLAVKSLPQRGDAYHAISALVIHANALTRLNANQLIALQQHVEQCGALLIRHASQNVFQQLSDNAGCNGRFVANAQTQISLQQQLEQLLQQPKPRLPNLNELQSLATAAASNNLQRATVLLGLYLGALLFGLLVKLPKPYLLAMPLGLALVVHTAGIASSNQVDWVAWSEVEANATVAQQVTLVSLNATRTTQAQLSLAQNEQDLTPIGMAKGSAEYQLHQDPNQPGAMLDFRTRLLEQHRFVFADAIQVTQPLAWSIQDGTPTARNLSTKRTEPMLFAWRGNRHVVPTLAAGESWQPSAEKASDWQDTAAERLFRARALTADALVLEHTAAAKNTNASQLLSLGSGQSYLLRRL